MYVERNDEEHKWSLPLRPPNWSHIGGLARHRASTKYFNGIGESIYMMIVLVTKLMIDETIHTPSLSKFVEKDLADRDDDDGRPHSDRSFKGS